MGRVQLALNVADIEASVAFYTKVFGVEPAKRRPGYANFAVADPPLKLVLIEGAGEPATLNHLGVEVDCAVDVATAQGRLAALGLDTTTEVGVECCYARQDKVWVDDPDGAPWEIYTVLADVDMEPGSLRTDDASGAACCAARPDLAGTVSDSSSCC